MDDFSVYGDSFELVLHNLKKVLMLCVDKNLVLNWEKYHFMVTQGVVLGHVVSSERIKVDKSKIDLIGNLPPPRIVKDIRSFLGHVGFYKRSIKYFTLLFRPMFNLLCQDKSFEGNDACQRAFD